MKTLNEIKTFIDEELLTTEETRYGVEVFNDVNVDTDTVKSTKDLEEAYNYFKELDLEEMDKQFAQLYVVIVEEFNGEEFEEFTNLDVKEQSKLEEN